MVARVSIGRVDPATTWLVKVDGKCVAAAKTEEGAARIALELGLDLAAVNAAPEVSARYAFVLGVVTVSATGGVMHGLTDSPEIASRTAESVDGEIHLVRLGPDFDGASTVEVNPAEYQILAD